MIPPREFPYLLFKAGRQKRDCVCGVFTKSALIYRLILWNQRTTRFLVFESIGDAQLFIRSKPLEERTYSEVVLGWRQQRIRFDIDRVSQDQFRVILLAIKHVWKTTTLFKPWEQRKGCKSYIFQSDIDGFHVLIDYYVPNASLNHAFCEAVIAHLKVTGHAAIAAHVDTTYANSQNLRMVGCYKYDMKLHKLGSYAKHPIGTRVTFANSIISLIYPQTPRAAQKS